MGTLIANSGVFNLDTRPPEGISSPFTVVAASGSSVECVWPQATDANFDHYEIWYGTNQTDVENRTGTAVKWDHTDDPSLAVSSTITTTITGVGTDTYYFSIFAIDVFEQFTRVDAGSTFSLVQEIASSNFIFDTLAPRDTNFLALEAISTSEVICTWNQATDLFFSRYEIWYSPDGGATYNWWSTSDDPNLGNIATTTTTVTGLTFGVTYFFRVYVFDDANNFIYVAALNPVRTYDILTDTFDAQLAISDARTKKGDGRIKVFQSNPNSFFGRFVVYDFTTEMFAGSLYVSDARTAHVDGRLKLFQSNPNNFFGRLVVYDFATALFDARLPVHRVTAGRFDGILSITQAAEHLLDGVLHIGYDFTRILKTRFHVGVDASTGFDSRAVITLHSQFYLFGRLYIVETAQNSFDGIIEVESRPKIDGKIWIKEIDAPFLANLNPGRNAVDVSFEPDIYFDIVDAGAAISGIDLTSVTIRLYIDNALGGEFRYTGTKGVDKFPLIRVTGDPTHYKFHLRFFLPGVQPFVRFNPGSIITMEIFAQDFSSNQLEDRYSFVVETLDREFTRREALTWTATGDFKFNLEYGVRYPVHDNAEPIADLLRLIPRSNSEE